MGVDDNAVDVAAAIAEPEAFEVASEDIGFIEFIVFIVFIGFIEAPTFAEGTGKHLLFCIKRFPNSAAGGITGGAATGGVANSPSLPARTRVVSVFIRLRQEGSCVRLFQLTSRRLSFVKDSRGDMRAKWLGRWGK